MTLAQNAPLAVRPLTVEVRSGTNPDQAYVVTLPYCPCKDFFHRRGNPFDLLCKHLKAGLGIPDTSKLDQEAAEELLTDLGASRQAAIDVLSRARQHGSSITTTVRTGTVVVLYSTGGGTYDVRLP